MTVPKPRIFVVGTQQVRVRAQPNTAGAEVRWLNPGEQVQCDPASRTEANGFIWWKHAEGWSAERSLDGRWVYLTEIFPAASPPVAPVGVASPADKPAALAPVTPAVPAAPAPVTPAPSPAGFASTPPPSPAAVPAPSVAAPKKQLQVGQNQVRVRDKAGLSGNSIKWLMPGTIIDLEPNSRLELDGFVWWKHAEGWSAERSLDSSQIFLVHPSFNVAPLPAPAPVPGPVISSSSAPVDQLALPLVGTLFKRLPVDLPLTRWWQYFGNNVFAYDLWAQGKNWYRYCQGLHGGLDFGNSTDSGVLVRAGVENGRFMMKETQYTTPNGMWVKVGDYTIIYGHLINPRPLNPGDPVGVDTILGELQLNGQNHLHLEIRYRDALLVNPLLYFSQEWQNQIIHKFPPSATYFYRDATWTKWQTPYDQPMLRLGGPLIGPHAPR